MALEVITFFFFFFAGPLSLPLSESRVGERDVFSLAVVWPNGPSKLCTNQLAQLTLEMVCQPVNLEQKGTAGAGGGGRRTGDGRVLRGNSCICLTAKGGQLRGQGEQREDVIDGSAWQSGRVN